MNDRDTIPEDVMKAARELAAEFARMNPAHANMEKKVMEYQLTGAIMAERLAERERAAKVAEGLCDEWVGENGAAACTAVADAIRNPS